MNKRQIQILKVAVALLESNEKALENKDFFSERPTEEELEELHVDLDLMEPE